MQAWPQGVVAAEMQAAAGSRCAARSKAGTSLRSRRVTQKADAPIVWICGSLSFFDTPGVQDTMGTADAAHSAGFRQ